VTPDDATRRDDTLLRLIQEVSELALVVREVHVRLLELEGTRVTMERQLHARVSEAIEKMEREFWRQSDIAREQIARLTGPPRVEDGTSSRGLGCSPSSDVTHAEPVNWATAPPQER